DLYAGVGLFSLALAHRHRAVTAVEGDRISARYARGNARRNKLAHVEVVPQAVESWVGALPDKRPRRLTYVSCHAATLARDLRELLGAYRLEKLALFDLFPQSGHME